MEHHFRHTIVQSSHIQDDLRQYLQHYLRYVPHARQLANQYRDAEMRRMSMTHTARVSSIVTYPVNLNVSLPGAQGLRVNIVHRMFGDNEVDELYPHYHLYPNVVSLNRGHPPEPPPRQLLARQPSPTNVRPITEEKIVELLNRDIISLSQKVRILASTAMFLVVLRKHSQITHATDMEVTNNDICSVCLSEVELSSVLRRLKCDHTFHQDCIDRWLLIYLTCPLCRRGIMGNAFEVNETLVDEEDFEPFEVHPDDASDDGQDEEIEAVPLLVRRRVVTPPPPSSPTPPRYFQPTPPRYFQPLPGPHVELDGTRSYLHQEEEAAGPSQLERRGLGFPSATASYVDLAKPGPSNFDTHQLGIAGRLSPRISPSFSSDDEEDDVSTGIPSPPQEQDWNKRKRLTLLIKKKETDSCQDDSDEEGYTSQVFENEVPITDDGRLPQSPNMQTEDEDDIQLIEPPPPPLIEIEDDEDMEAKDRLSQRVKRTWESAMGYDRSSSGGASYSNLDEHSSEGSSKRRACEWEDDMQYQWPSTSSSYHPASYSPFSTPHVGHDRFIPVDGEQTPVAYYSPLDQHTTDEYLYRASSEYYDFDQGNSSVHSTNEGEAAAKSEDMMNEVAKLPNLLQAADLSLAKPQPLSSTVGSLDNEGQPFYCFEALTKKSEHSSPGSTAVNSECGSQDFSLLPGDSQSAISKMDVKEEGDGVIVVLDSEDEDNSNNNVQKTETETLGEVSLDEDDDDNNKQQSLAEVIVISDDED